MVCISRTNTGVSTHYCSEDRSGTPRVDHSDYVTLRQQLQGTFVTLGVMAITARLDAEDASHQGDAQRVVESRGLHAHVH